MKARRSHAANGDIGAYRAQHLALNDPPAGLPEVGRKAKFDEAESPLVWLARRKGTDGRALIAPHQLQAGERLRREFTCGQLMPRTTSNWDAPVAGRHRSATGATPADRVLIARQQVRHALDAVGPEFAGLLLDVCCFLKRLDEVERERRWPARSAKVVLQLALERLARHYGYASEMQGAPTRRKRVWTAPAPEEPEAVVAS